MDYYYSEDTFIYIEDRLAHELNSYKINSLVNECLKAVEEYPEWNSIIFSPDVLDSEIILYKIKTGDIEIYLYDAVTLKKKEGIGLRWIDLIVLVMAELTFLIYKDFDKWSKLFTDR